MKCLILIFFLPCLKAASKKPGSAGASDENCYSYFEVSSSTIIRTADSRSLGAHYINETDLVTKEDCMTLCCNTPKCNVAVFEEKVINT